MATADIQGGEGFFFKVIKSNGAESDFFFFSQPKTPQKEDHLRGAGLVNLFEHWMLIQCE